MGFWSSLFGSGTTPEEDVQREIQKATPLTPSGGLRGAVLGRDHQFQKGVGYAIRRGQREQYVQQKRQDEDLERRHHDYERPETVRYWDQSLGLSRTKDELTRLKTAGDPYASHVEYNLKYIQQQYDNYMRDYDKQWDRQKYDRKYAFQQQQKDYEKQTRDSAYKQLEQAREQHKKRQAIQTYQQMQGRAQSDVSKRQLGTGGRFRGFTAPQARGSFGRGRQQQRPSFTRAGR